MFDRKSRTDYRKKKTSGVFAFNQISPRLRHCALSDEARDWEKLRDPAALACESLFPLSRGLWCRFRLTHGV